MYNNKAFQGEQKSRMNMNRRSSPGIEMTETTASRVDEVEEENVYENYIPGLDDQHIAVDTCHSDEEDEYGYDNNNHAGF